MMKSAHEKTYDLIEAVDLAFLYRSGASGNIIVSGNTPNVVDLITSRLAAKNHLAHLEITEETDLFGYVEANGTEIPSKMLDLYKNGGVCLIDTRCIKDPEIMKKLKEMLRHNGQKHYPFLGKKEKPDLNFMLIAYSPDADKTFDSTTLYSTPILNIDPEITPAMVLEVQENPIKYCPYVDALFKDLDIDLAEGEKNQLLKQYVPQMVTADIPKSQEELDTERNTAR